MTDHTAVHARQREIATEHLLFKYTRAVRIFGAPDFIHLGWDTWAKQEVMPGDTAVFARGTFDDAPSGYSFPDLREDG